MGGAGLRTKWTQRKGYEERRDNGVRYGSRGRQELEEDRILF